MITLGTVDISQKTKDLMQEALNKGIIGQGEYIKEFENKLADFLGVKYAIATANGTLADACALAAARYKDNSQRNEVIVPALTFVAQINALYYNHLKPVFVDVKEDFQIDTEKIEEKITEKTLAIMPTHLLGKPAKMEKIIDLAKSNNLFVIEDACEALGSRYQGAFCGTIGDMGTFSFFVSHAITTGEGGLVVTNDEELATLVRSLRNHGRKSENLEDKFIFSYIGFSAKMNALEAIIGLGIIDELPKYLEKRHRNMMMLNTLVGKDWLFQKEDEYIVPHSYPVLVKSRKERDALLTVLPQKFGIEARQIFYSIPTQGKAYEFLGEEEGRYPIAESIGNRGLYVPCHQSVSKEEIATIASALKEII